MQPVPQETTHTMSVSISKKHQHSRIPFWEKSGQSEAKSLHIPVFGSIQVDGADLASNTSMNRPDFGDTHLIT